MYDHVDIKQIWSDRCSAALDAVSAIDDDDYVCAVIMADSHALLALALRLRADLDDF